MEDWVCDLTEQNKLLLNEIEVLEKEASGRPLEQPSASAERLRSRANEELKEKNKRLCQLASEVECLKRTLSYKGHELASSMKQVREFEQSLCQKIEECAELKKLNASDRISHLEDDLSSLNRALKQKDVVLDQYMCQVEELQERIAEKENELEEERLTGCSRLIEMESKVDSLKEELNEKEFQLEKYNDQIAELHHCINSRTQVERRLVDQCSMTEECFEDIDTLSKAQEDLKLKEGEVKKISAQLKELLNSRGNSQVEELHRTLAQLQRASRDVQSALTAEVAEKHDTVVALRREVAQLEEQLRQSDMQTHFKDDIIKQLRKEVKMARAKESLAEIFGLKECPRIQMKEKIERLNAELEDKQSVITNLEQKLEATQQQELEEKITKLNKQLMSRERDVLTLCNKMDYVRRYVKRLRDDEDLSIKCGLEALLHELNEDSEWNKETRRSVSSLSDHISDSVIIINRVPSRSLSLPDSSLQKRNEWNLRTWTEAAAIQPELSSEENIIFDKSGGICKLRELQRNLDDSSSKLSKMWKDIKLLSLEISNNTIYNDLEEFKDDTKLDYEALEQVNKDIQNIVRRIEHGLSTEANEMDKKYLLCCLENNMTSMMDFVQKQNLIKSDSVHTFHATGSICQDQVDLVGLTENLATHLCDSLSILQQIKKSCEAQEQIFALNKGMEDKLKEIQITLDDVISNRKRAFHKLCCIQKMQSESYCNIAQKFAAFDEMYNIHEVTAKCMKHEVINIVRKLSSKDIQSERTEVAFQQNKSEIESLRDTISARDQEIMKKDRTICILKKSLYQKPMNLRTSHSSPLPGRPYGDVDYEVMKNFDEKSFQTQQVVDGLRKEIESTMCKLLDRENKLGSLERVADTLSRSLFSVQTEMRNLKPCLKSSGNTPLDGKIHILEANLNQAELDVKRFLTKSQNYVRDKEAMEKSRIEAQRAIATLQSDLSNLQIDLSDSLKIIKMPPSLSSHEHALVEGFRCQLDTYKKKVDHLEEDLSRNSVLSDLVLEPQLSSHRNSNNILKETPLMTMTATLDCTQQQLFEMQQDMKKSLQEVYCSFSKKDSDVLTTLQITEEVEVLRNEISGLQIDLKSRQKVIENQQETITLLEESLERSKCETDNLSSKLQTLLYEKKNVEMENQRVMQELQAKVCSLQAVLQKGHTNAVSSEKQKAEVEALRDANLELCIVAGRFKQKYDHAQQQLSSCYRDRFKSEAEELEETKVELCRQKEKLETHLKEKSCSHTQCKGQIKSLKDLLNDTEVELCHAKQQMNEMKLTIDELKTRLGLRENESSKTSTLQNELLHLKKIIDELSLEKDLALNELNQEQSENALNCEHIITLKNEYEVKCQEVQHWLNRANKQKENTQKLFEEIQDLQRENVGLNENIRSLHSEINSLTNELLVCKNENAQLSTKLMKSNQMVTNFTDEKQRLAEKLATEKEHLLCERNQLMTLHTNEVEMLRKEELEWNRRYEQKCEEAFLLNSELELRKKECEEKNGMLQNHKEAVDFLSGKVAQLNMRLDDKKHEVEILECQIKELANKYKDTESLLKNECTRVCLFEKKIGSLKDRVSSMKLKIEQLELYNESLKLEKHGLMEALEKKAQEDKDKESCAVALLNKSASMDNLREQRKFSVRLAQKLRVYKERLRVSIEQNRCLLEILDKIHHVNSSLLDEMQKNKNTDWSCPWSGEPQIPNPMTSPDPNPCYGI